MLKFKYYLPSAIQHLIHSCKYCKPCTHYVKLGYPRMIPVAVLYKLHKLRDFSLIIGKHEPNSHFKPHGIDYCSLVLAHEITRSVD